MPVSDVVTLNSDQIFNCEKTLLEAARERNIPFRQLLKAAYKIAYIKGKLSGEADILLSVCPSNEIVKNGALLNMILTNSFREIMEAEMFDAVKRGGGSS